MSTSGRRVARQTSLLSVALTRSFSRSSLGLRLSQESGPSQSQRSWVNMSCMATALVGLSLSFFSTRQLYDDPNSRCLIGKKS